VAEQLKIEIDVSAAKAALGQLTQTFKQFNATASSVGSGASQAISKLNSEMAKIKPLNPAVLAGLTAMSDAITRLSSGSLSGLADQMKNIGAAAPALKDMAASVEGVGKAIASIKAPEGISQLNVNLVQTARVMTAAEKAARAKAAAMREAQNAVRTLGTELVNAVGFMSGFGVTLGNALSALSQISKSGMSMSGVMQNLTQTFGAFGAKLVLLGGAAVALNAVASAFGAIVGPVLQATQAMSSFRNTLEAVRGAGAGAEALRGLKELALSTGQDIMSLAKNFQQFDTAAKDAGLTMDQSMQIMRGFSTAFAVLGTSTVDADRAFKSLAQMMAKGTIQMEELKGQMGDAVPAAAGAFHKAMGISQKELMKLAQSGALVSKEILPKVAEYLNKTYGGGLVASLQTVVAQFNNMKTIFSELLDALGSGNFGGIAGGIASGLAMINEALDSEGLVTFARALGDLIGVLSAAALGAIGGFAEGVVNLADGVSKLLGVFVPLTPALEKVVNQMGGVAGIFSTLGQVAGTAFAAWATASALGAAKTVLLSQAVKDLGAKALMAGGMFLGSAKNVGYMTAAVNLLKGAASALWALLARTPLGALALALGVIVTVGKKVYDSFKSNAEAAALMQKAAETGSMATAGIANALERLAKADASETIKKTGDAINSLKGLQSQAAMAIGDVTEKLGQYQSALDSSNASMDRARANQEAYAQDIERENSSIEARIESITKQQKAFDESRAAAAELAKEMGRTEEETKGMGEAIDISSGRIERLKREMQENKQALQESTQALKDREAREKEYQASVEQSMKIEQQRQEYMRNYGVAMNDEAVAMAKKLENLGLEKEAITDYLAAQKLMTEGIEGQIERLDEEISKKDELIKFNQEMIRSAESEIQKIKERVEAGKMGAQEGERQIDLQERLISARNGAIGKLTEEVTAERAAKIVREQGVSDMEALGLAIDQTAAKTGVKVEQDKAAEAQLKNINAELEKQAGVTADSGSAWDTFTGFVKGAWDSFMKAEESTTKTTEAVKAATAAVVESTPTMTEFNTQATALSDNFNNVATATQNLATSLPIINENLITINGTITSNAESLTVFKDTLGEIATHFTTLSTNGPAVGEAFTQMTTAVITGAEPMGAFAANLERIPETTEGIGLARDAVIEMVEKIIEAQGDFASAEEAIRKIAKAAEEVAVGFKKAIEEGDNFISKLNDVIDKTGEAIGRMEALKRAAEEALDAANRAANSGGGGGTTQGGRYGGMSGNLPETQRLSDMSVFNNAPQFRDGTANTSGNLSKVPGGGIPSILHPNEAVVPLPKGRSIPVEIKMPPMPSAKPVTSDINLAPLNDLTYVLGQLDRTMEAAVQKFSTPSVEVAVPEVDVAAQPQRAYYQSPNGLESSNLNSPNESGSARENSEVRQPAMNITVNVSATDLDSFRRSEDQIARALSDKISRAKRRTSR
jgi:tape measure domain-containing protein